MDKVVDLYLNIASVKTKWQTFLTGLGLHNFSERELAVIDHTLGLVDETGKLVGTGSIAGNVLKYIGVQNDDAHPGARFNQIVTALQQYLFSQQIFHCFVFTKEKYSASFSHLGFRELAHTEEAAFLESGTPDINDYVAALPQVPDQKNKRVAAVVMNANPFTLGHQQLVAQASRENDLVYVFVVATDASLFKTSERMKLVQAGTAACKNVQVVSGGDYLVSSATFPAYFLKSPDELIKTQTVIDARVFKKYLVPALAIKARYLGTEPFSRTTNFYNESLKQELEPEVAVQIIPRYQVNGKVITATKVRQAIKDDSLSQVKEMLPDSTWQFIEANKKILQDRIKKGMKINGN
ncbi:[citrate (pro-3S)-lyase] ligase [Lactobacillus sp. ESL0791]|uniref:[citrate (pro-3S)-lyase] ligase n=1 Tax=Lactobacillus sp. ESL0791 TaxID=2983234 RepID=UPI0023F99CEB|nr:[citrate (pro-3S)-lyase] ligase [Lactobacillus sp. ESL0791]MDF7638990.1 [citrate (pro-3S)-lyase] ligase [Lactobacillus sp. ESL0791]